MSRYRLYLENAQTDHVVDGKSPAKALVELCRLAGLELVKPGSRWGRTADGQTVGALTEPYGRRKLDPLERQTRVG